MKNLLITIKEDKNSLSNMMCILCLYPATKNENKKGRTRRVSESQFTLPIEENEYGEYYPNELQEKFLKILCEIGIIKDVEIDENSLLEEMFGST